VVRVKRIAREALELRKDLVGHADVEAPGEGAEMDVRARLTSRELPEGTPAGSQDAGGVNLDRRRQVEGKVAPVSTWPGSSTDDLAVDDGGLAIEGLVDERDATLHEVVGVHDHVLAEVEDDDRRG